MDLTEASTKGQYHELLFGNYMLRVILITKYSPISEHSRNHSQMWWCIYDPNEREPDIFLLQEPFWHTSLHISTAVLIYNHKCTPTAY